MNHKAIHKLWLYLSCGNLRKVKRANLQRTPANTGSIIETTWIEPNSVSHDQAASHSTGGKHK